MANTEIEKYLYRLGSLKNTNLIAATWNDIAKIMNNTFMDENEQKPDDYWRKKFNKMIQTGYKPDDPEFDLENDPLITFFRGVESQRQRTHDERLAITRAKRSSDRENAVLDILSDEIRRYEPTKSPYFSKPLLADTAVCALVSDIHFGLAYNNKSGSYNPDIACERLARYADEIAAIGMNSGAYTCNIVLLGDIISGLIHPTIRIENRENVIRQTVHASEAICEFIKSVSEYFDTVNVYSTNGNHSRLTFDRDDSLCGERLDAIIPWYCKAKFENCDRVKFFDGTDTYCIVDIFGRKYAAVHGDMDKDIEKTALFVERTEGITLSGILAGHTHVAESRSANIDFIRNGCLCGSGDEHCIRNRLYGVPVQTCLVVSESGIESIHPIRFDAGKTNAA